MNRIKAKYTIKDFTPLITIVGLILLFSVIITSYLSEDVMFGMRMFMGGFFLVFGLLKASKLSGFVEAYQTYDLIAKRSKGYAYIYPFIEIGLGLMFFTWIAPAFTLITTIVLMLISAVGVYQKLKKNEVVMCACLGTVFKVPMTWVTLAENMLMVVMASVMLLV
jgi:hypothetical protein